MKNKPVYVPYMSNENIDFATEYQLSPRVLLQPGDRFKVRGVYGIFKFLRHAWNTKLQTEWIDCTDARTFEFRAFRPEQIRRRVK